MLITINESMNTQKTQLQAIGLKCQMLQLKVKKYKTPSKGKQDLNNESRDLKNTSIVS